MGVTGRHARSTATLNCFLDEGGWPVCLAHGCPTLECLVAHTLQELHVFGAGVHLICDVVGALLRQPAEESFGSHVLLEVGVVFARLHRCDDLLEVARQDLEVIIEDLVLLGGLFELLLRV